MSNYNDKHPQVSIVVPLYNEAESFARLVSRLNGVMESFKECSVEVVLVDDGSRDATPALMHELASSDKHYQAVFLARNYGHQLALSAGYASARGSIAVMAIDGDLQDPPELLGTFYAKMKEGYDVVYGIRKNRKENFLKKSAYHFFYVMLKKISTIDIPIDSGDFSLISRRVVNVMNKMPEEDRYLRGMRSWVGFKQTGIEYDRDKRMEGETKYSLRKLIQLAYMGIFNFSEFPVKLIKRIGYLSIIVAFGYFVYAVVRKYIYHVDTPSGFVGLLFAIVLFGGLSLISIGLLGEYIIRIFFQVKGRPLFIIREKIVEGDRKTSDENQS